MPKVGDRFNPHRLFDGVFVPESVCKYRGVSPGSKLAYGRFCRYSGSRGEVYPSMATLGEEIGCRETQAKSYVHELVEDGFIEVEYRTGKSSVYHFVWHPCFDGEVGDQRFDPPCLPGRDADPVLELVTGSGCRPGGGRDADRVPGRDADPEESHLKESQEESQGSASFSNSKSPRLDIDTEGIIEEFVKNAYRPTKAKLVNLRSKEAQAPGGICQKLREAEELHGRVEIRIAVQRFLESQDDWLRSNRWPIRAFLKTVDLYLPELPPRKTKATVVNLPAVRSRTVPAGEDTPNPATGLLAWFTELWEIYPEAGRKDRADSFAEYQKHIQTEQEHAALMDALEDDWIPYFDSLDPKYVKRLKSWLRNECWKEPAPAVTGKKTQQPEDDGYVSAAEYNRAYAEQYERERKSKTTK